MEVLLKQYFDNDTANIISDYIFYSKKQWKARLDWAFETLRYMRDWAYSATLSGIYPIGEQNVIDYLLSRLAEYEKAGRNPYYWHMRIEEEYMKIWKKKWHDPEKQKARNIAFKVAKKEQEILKKYKQINDDKKLIDERTAKIITLTSELNKILKEDIEELDHNGSGSIVMLRSLVIQESGTDWDFKTIHT